MDDNIYKASKIRVLGYTYVFKNDAQAECREALQQIADELDLRTRQELNDVHTGRLYVHVPTSKMGEFLTRVDDISERESSILDIIDTSETAGLMSEIQKRCRAEKGDWKKPWDVVRREAETKTEDKKQEVNTSKEERRGYAINLSILFNDKSNRYVVRGSLIENFGDKQVVEEFVDFTTSNRMGVATGIFNLLFPAVGYSPMGSIPIPCGIAARKPLKQLVKEMRAKTGGGCDDGTKG
jgi:hypothetical protein